MVPVRPGDVVNATYTIQEKRDLASRPDVGVAKVLVELFNQKGETAANWRTNQLTRRRHPGPAPSDRGQKRERKAIASLWDEAGAASPLRPDLYFEDRKIGELTDLGTHTFGKDDIIAFAREYDPQPFHLDEAAAKAALFGALCASGWHTAAHAIRGNITSRLRGNEQARAQGVRLAAYGPSPGFRGLSWFKPTYVGDTLEYRGRLAQKIDHEVAPRARHRRHRHSGAQPEGRDRVRRHLADPGRAPRALSADINVGGPAPKARRSAPGRVQPAFLARCLNMWPRASSSISALKACLSFSATARAAAGRALTSSTSRLTLGNFAQASSPMMNGTSRAQPQTSMSTML